MDDSKATRDVSSGLNLDAIYEHAVMLAYDDAMVEGLNDPEGHAHLRGIAEVAAAIRKENHVAS